MHRRPGRGRVHGDAGGRLHRRTALAPVRDDRRPGRDRQLALHALSAPGGVPGALNFYATAAGAFADPTARTVAAAFATQAAIAVYGRNRVRHLTLALATRDVIGRAKGILMERFTLHDDEAFTLLVRSSQDTNLKLVDVAAWVNDEATRRADARPGGPRLGGSPAPTGPGRG